MNRSKGASGGFRLRFFGQNITEYIRAGARRAGYIRAGARWAGFGFFRADGCWHCPDGREDGAGIGRAAFMPGEGRPGGGAYAREKGDLGESSICPGKGRSRRRRICPGEGWSRRRQYMSGKGEFRRRQSFVKRF